MFLLEEMGVSFGEPLTWRNGLVFLGLKKTHPPEGDRVPRALGMVFGGTDAFCHKHKLVIVENSF